MKNRVYSKEFKEQAVRLSYQRAKLKGLADELGISVERIYKWRRAAKDAVNPTVKQAKQEDQEIKRLRKALKDKELELEILKKAVHIFSKSDGRSMSS